jgi:nucleoside-diphosphate-sugar epimerase
MRKSDFVYFLAFDVGGSPYLEKYQDSFKFIQSNLRIMLNTFEILREFRVPFVFASSQMSNMSHSTYGHLKAIGERYTRALSGRIVMFWNVYGVERDPSKFHVISDFIRMGLNGGPISMRTDGLETRDFLYATDCCEGLEAIMTNYEKLIPSQELHLAMFEWTSVLGIAEIVANRLNVRIVPGEKTDSVQGNLKYNPNSYFLKYLHPKTNVHQGINKIIDYFESSANIHL